MISRVGSSTCSTPCPVQAISFSDCDLVWKVEREHKHFKVVLAEPKEKMAKQDALKTRIAAKMRKYGNQFV